MNSKQYNWLTNYSLLFIWPIIYAVICWWIVYIENPEIITNVSHIGYTDHSFYGIKQSLSNLPIILIYSIYFFYYYVLILGGFYFIFRIIRKSKYHIFVSIPIIIILSLIGIYALCYSAGIWFEKDFATKKLLEIIDIQLSVLSILYILACIHFTILFFIKRNNPFSKYIYLNTLAFFILWWISRASQLLFTENKFDLISFIIPGTYFKIGLFWTVLISYLYVKKANRRLIILVLISFILFALINFNLKNHVNETISIITIFLSLTFTSLGFLEKQRKRKYLITIGALLLLIYLTINIQKDYNSGYRYDLIPYSWQGITV